MFRFIPVFIFMTMLCLPAFAEEKDPLKKELRAAGQITDSDARLKSYDAVLEKYALRKKPAKAELTEAKWGVDVKSDPVTDEKVITATIMADSGRSSWDQPVWLVIRKSAERLELYIGWNSYLGSEAVVTYRVGKEVPETKEWSLSSDSQASFYTGDTVDVISRMLKADQVVARCTPYNESPITAVFDIRGLRKELEKYKDDFGAVLDPPKAEEAGN